jgi:hypothetical protein
MQWCVAVRSEMQSTPLYKEVHRGIIKIAADQHPQKTSYENWK